MRATSGAPRIHHPRRPLEFHGHGGRVNGIDSIALSSPDGQDAVVIAFNLKSDADPMLVALADELLCGAST